MIVCLVLMMSGMLCDLCGWLSSLVLFTKYAILVDFLIYFLRSALFFVVVLLCCCAMLFRALCFASIVFCVRFIAVVVVVVVVVVTNVKPV